MADWIDDTFSEVVDGDTYSREDGSRVRAIGGNAPEFSRGGSKFEPGARTSMDWFEEAFKTSDEARSKGTDVYGRERVELMRDGENVMHQSVRAGMANPEWRNRESAEARDHFMQRRALGLDTEWDEARDRERENMRAAGHGAQANFGRSFRGVYEDDRGTASKAWERGVDNLRASVGAAAQYIGAQTGVDAFAEWGEEEMADAMLDVQLNPREVENWQHIEGVGDTGTWILQTLAENAPNLLMLAGGAGVGGAAGAVGGSFLKSLFRRSATKKLTEEAAKRGGGFLPSTPGGWGAAAGGAAGIYPQHLGEYSRELLEGGVDLGEADGLWLAAAANSVLDTGGAALILRTAFKGLGTDLAKDLVEANIEKAARSGALRRIAGDIGKGAGVGLLEAPIEMSHELMYMTARQYYDPDYEIDFSDPETQLRLSEAALAGATVGGVLGGAGRGSTGTLREIFNQSQETQPGTGEAAPPEDLPPGGTQDVRADAPTGRAANDGLLIDSVTPLEPDPAGPAQVDDGSPPDDGAPPAPRKRATEAERRRGRAKYYLDELTAAASLRDRANRARDRGDEGDAELAARLDAEEAEINEFLRANREEFPDVEADAQALRAQEADVRGKSGSLLADAAESRRVTLHREIQEKLQAMSAAELRRFAKAQRRRAAATEDKSLADLMEQEASGAEQLAQARAGRPPTEAAPAETGPTGTEVPFGELDPARQDPPATDEGAPTGPEVGSGELGGPPQTPSATEAAKPDLPDTRNRWLPKDREKWAQANKMIGRGGPQSSTQRYADALGPERANTGSYTPDDVVFVSAEGNRRDRQPPDFDEIGRAADAGATFVTDRKGLGAQPGTRSSRYNVGEREVAEFLESRGYRETDGDGVWRPPTELGQEPVTSPAPTAEGDALPPRNTIEEPGVGDRRLPHLDESDPEAYFEGYEQHRDAIEEIGRVAQETVRGWVGPLGLDAPEVTITRDLPPNILGRYQQAASGERRILLNLGALNEMITSRSRGQARVAALEVLAHETGHFLHHNLIEEAPAEVQLALKEAHAKWRAEHRESRPVEAQIDRLQPVIGARMQGRLGRADREADEGGRSRPRGDRFTALSEAEWFADQIGRYIMHRESVADTSTPAVRRFMRDAARIIRRLYNRIAQTMGHRRANQDLADYLDAVRESIRQAKEEEAAALTDAERRDVEILGETQQQAPEVGPEEDGPLSVESGETLVVDPILTPLTSYRDAQTGRIVEFSADARQRGATEARKMLRLIAERMPDDLPPEQAFSGEVTHAPGSGDIQTQITLPPQGARPEWATPGMIKRLINVMVVGGAKSADRVTMMRDTGKVDPKTGERVLVEARLNVPELAQIGAVEQQLNLYEASNRQIREAVLAGMSFMAREFGFEFKSGRIDIPKDAAVLVREGGASVKWGNHGWRIAEAQRSRTDKSATRTESTPERWRKERAAQGEREFGELGDWRSEEAIEARAARIEAWYAKTPAKELAEGIARLVEDGVVATRFAERFNKPGSAPGRRPRLAKAKQLADLVRRTMQANLKEDAAQGARDRADQRAERTPIADRAGQSQTEGWDPSRFVADEPGEVSTPDSVVDGGYMVQDSTERQHQRSVSRRGDTDAATPPSLPRTYGWGRPAAQFEFTGHVSISRADYEGALDKNPHWTNGKSKERAKSDPENANRMLVPRYELVHDEGAKPLPDGGLTRPGRGLAALRATVKGASKAARDTAVGIQSILQAVGVNLETAPVFLESKDQITTLVESMTDAVREANAQTLRDLYRDDPPARVVFLREGGQVRPVIYVSARVKSGRVRNRMVLHEVGHIVLRHTVQNTTPEALSALQEVLGPLDDRVAFEENFANAFLSWAQGTSQLFQGEPGRASVREAFETFFSDLWRTLRRLWNRARKEFPHDQRFADFMEQLINRRRSERNIEPLPRSAMKTPWGKRMADMVEGKLTGSPLLKHDDAWAESLDWTPFPKIRAAHHRGATGKAGEVFEKGRRMSQAAMRDLGTLWKHAGRTFDKRWRTMINPATGRPNRVTVRIADRFRKIPGVRDTISAGATVTWKERQFQEQYQQRIDAIVDRYSTRTKFRHVFTGLPDPHPVLQEAYAALIADRPAKTEASQKVADEFRQLFRDLHAEARGTFGMDLGFRQNYLPMVYSAARANTLGRDWFRAQVRAWAAENPEQAKEFFARQADPQIRRLHGRLTRDERALRAQLEEREFTPAEQDALADYLYTTFTRNDGVFNPIDRSSQFDGDFAAPGFQYRKARRLPDELHSKLRDARETNMTQVAAAYSRKMITRAAWHQEFGLHKVIADIQERFQHARDLFEDGASRGNVNTFLARNPQYRDVYDSLVEQRADEGNTQPITLPALRAHGWEMAYAYRDQVAAEYSENYNLNIYDPTAQLKVDLRDEVYSGRLSQNDFREATETLLPGYLGTLGADSSPLWRRIQQVMMVYQAVRVLSMGVFAQFVDVGTVISRAESGYRKELLPLIRDMWKERGTNEEGHATGYQGMMEIGRMMGLVQRDVVQHLINDNMGMLSMNDRLGMINELFFRYNGMHFSTNFMRMVSANLARRLFQSYARDGRGDLLAEVNVTLEEAQAWVDAGMPVEFGKGHDNMVGAMHQFTDESIVFPDASLRPHIGNDKRSAVFWHLKSFMWGFHAQILERAWNQSRTKWGDKEGMARMQAAMPFLMLASVALPMAMLGMELRWLISSPDNRPVAGSAGYFFEAFERSGMTGIPQLLIDADAAENYGRSGVFAIGGPSVSHLEEIITTGPTEGVINRSLPAYPIVRAIREAMQ